jgi:hypothetical protein
MHDYNKYNELGGIKHEDAFHNPDNIAQGSPFIQERPWYNYGPAANNNGPFTPDGKSVNTRETPR